MAVEQHHHYVDVNNVIAVIPVLEMQVDAISEIKV